MKSVCYLLLLLIATTAFGQSNEFKEKILHQIASKHYPPTFSAVAAKLRTGVNRDIALKQLDTLLDREYGDMFWMYGCTGLYLSTKEELPQSYKKKMRECWKKCTPYRGDTENHFLMYYASLFLLSEEWPNESADAWFLGKSSTEIHNESKDYLDFWINRTVRFGQIEFDSPRYLYYFITPLVLLVEYSRDTGMKHKSEMMLEVLLADYATMYVNGNFCGAHSRISSDVVFNTRKSEASSYGEYFFEDSVTHLLPDIAFAALSSFHIPSIIKKIAHQKSKTFVQIEMKRSRDAIRFDKQMSTPVHKYTYMTPQYALGSIQGGLIQPIQQQSWSLTLNSNQKYNTIFGLHPYISETELGKYFPEEPSFMLEKIEGVKNGYTSENKWVGGSPCEKICQDTNQLWCKYNISTEIRSQHVDIFLPDWGVFLKKDQDQYLIQYDSLLVLIEPHTPSTLTTEAGGLRLRMSVKSSMAGYHLVCMKVGETLDYRNAMEVCDRPSISPDSLREKKLYDSPFIESVFGSAILKVKCGTEERTLDFITNTIR
ncbi:MAG: hypothetical protein WCH46_08550 [bacterium]